MTSEIKELQSTLEKDSSAGSQSRDEAMSLTNDHEKQNATYGSMVDMCSVAEEGQCSPGNREHCREMVCASDLGPDKQDSNFENSDEENRKGCRCGIGLEYGPCIGCTLACGILLLVIGITLGAHIP